MRRETALLGTLAAVSIFSMAALPLPASVITVDINTSAIQNSAGYLALDFIGGTPVAGNSVIISAFGSNGILGAGSPSGSLLGTLVPGPLTLTDLQFFNEWLQPLTFSTTISFVLTLTIIDSQGSIPDAFSLFLLNSSQLPFATSDPSGANSLIEIDIDSASPTPKVFTSSFATATMTPVTDNVPEASSIWLVFSVFSIGGVIHRIKRVHYR